MKRMYRAQILLEPEQYEELSHIARQESRSIPEIARRAEVLRRLRNIRRAIQRKTAIIQRDLLQETREERLGDLLPGEHG